MPLFLGPHDLKAIHRTVVEKFGVSPEVHNEEAIHQVSSEVHYRAFREFSNETSLDLFDVSGMYAASVNERMPLLEGNAQTAKLAALTLLKINGVDPGFPFLRLT
jgi:prophage maintenance system killer protein